MVAEVRGDDLIDDFQATLAENLGIEATMICLASSAVRKP